MSASVKRKPVLDRAIEIAKSGSVASVGELLIRLSMEGYEPFDVTDPAVRAQLRQLIKEGHQTRRVVDPSSWPYGWIAFGAVAAAVLILLLRLPV